MTTAAWIALAAAAGFALLDWVAVARSWRVVEGFAKPWVILCLLAMTVAIDPFDEAVRALVLIALVFSGLGDVFLFADERLFLAGLVSFLIAHVHYIFAFLIAGVALGWFVAGLVGFGLVAGRVGLRIARAAGGGRPDVAVSLYIVVLLLMGACAVGTGDWLPIAGGILFVTSDSVLGWTRFVERFPNDRVVVHATYHLAQAAFVGYLATGG